MLEASLVRRSGTAALTGHYLVQLLQSDNILTVPDIFVSTGVQSIPLAGSAELEPRHFSASLQTHFSTFPWVPFNTHILLHLLCLLPSPPPSSSTLPRLTRRYRPRSIQAPTPQCRSCMIFYLVDDPSLSTPPTLPSSRASIY